MLFNSYAFILVFLPVTWAGWWLLRQACQHTGALIWLAAASLVFYGLSSLQALAVILVSLIVNFLMGRAIHDRRAVCRGTSHGLRAMLVGGIAFNLGLIGYYKYIGFLAANLDATGLPIGTFDILLPAGISFFTFQQIAWLVDTYRGDGERPELLRHVLFVTFFPQLIAGPIVHHKEMMPQFDRIRARFGGLSGDVAVGITIFAIGLAKKVLIADNLSPLVGPAFERADMGLPLTSMEAWSAALAYSGQIYFDFSGYSDMAIGLARLFGITLPLNFNSPYKAVSIAEFWRRWHMTLSRFLKDYLYVPLGGNRDGRLMQTRNLMITMLLGGLWHGAAWNFVIWGGLHGVFLAINHAWSRHVGPVGGPPFVRALWRIGCWYLTFTLVVVAWVFFRAGSLDGALSMLGAMAGANGFGIDRTFAASLAGVPVLGEALARAAVPDTLRLYDVTAFLTIYGALLLACVAPNTQEIMARFRPALDFRFAPRGWWQWRPTAVWGFAMSGLLLAGLWGLGSVASEFLYFQF